MEEKVVNEDAQESGEAGIPEAAHPPYPDLTNQDVLNVFDRAVNATSWWKWVVLAELEGLAASPEVRKEIYTGPKFEDLPGLTSEQKQALVNNLPGAEVVEEPQVAPPAEGRWVKIFTTRSFCQSFKKRDKSGKPIMQDHRPAVQLNEGDRLNISDTHTESEKDKGNGVVYATGMKEHYLILGSPDNPDAANLFVMTKVTTPTAAPAISIDADQKEDGAAEIIENEPDVIAPPDTVVPDPTDTEGPLAEQGFWIHVNARKSACQYFKKLDKSGKPVMIPVKPTVRLDHGARLRVSGTHKVGEKDKGDGVVFATGMKEFYYILESPDNPDAVEKYVKKVDTAKE